MTCPECHKKLEIAVCVGPHPRYREIYLTPARIEYYRQRQEQERAERYGRGVRVMKQETIERLRAEYELTKDGRMEPDQQVWHRWWPPFVREVGEAFPDILAVLEAARDYAEAEERSLAQYEAETVPPLDDRIAANRARNKAHDALLALIDLGGTE